MFDGLIIFVEILMKRKAPKPNPERTIPDARPFFSGKKSQACSLAQY